MLIVYDYIPDLTAQLLVLVNYDIGSVSHGLYYDTPTIIIMVGCH